MKSGYEIGYSWEDYHGRDTAEDRWYDIEENNANTINVNGTLRPSTN